MQLIVGIALATHPTEESADPVITGLPVFPLDLCALRFGLNNVKFWTVPDVRFVIQNFLEFGRHPSDPGSTRVGRMRHCQVDFLTKFQQFVADFRFQIVGRCRFGTLANGIGQGQAVLWRC